MLKIQNLMGDITAPYQNVNENRWLEDLNNSEHHSLPCISSSMVKYMASHSPHAFYQKYIVGSMNEQTTRDEFRVGTLIHLAILEPEKFEKYVKTCDMDQRTKDFKDYRKELIDTLNGKTRIKAEILTITNEFNENSEVIVFSENKKPKRKSKSSAVASLATARVEDSGSSSSEIELDSVILGKNGGYLLESGEELYLVKSSEMSLYRTIQRNCERHLNLLLLLPGCKIEQSGIAQCPRTGLWLSCRGDARGINSEGQGYFIDPKSINKLSMRNMKSAIENFHYDLQHIHYLYVANLIPKDTASLYSKDNIDSMRGLKDISCYEYFYFLFVCKETGEVCLVHLSEDDVAKARKIYHRTLDKIAECQHEKRWPTLDKGKGLGIELSPWHHKNMLELNTEI